MASLSELQARRAKLWEARADGVRSFRDSDGQEVTYRSDAELANAISAIDREIARLSGTPKTIVFRTSKGLEQ